MAGKRMLFAASWIILLVVFAAVAILSFMSLMTAYTGPQDNLIQGFTLEDLKSAGGDEAVSAFRGRRATAATWSLGYALIALMVVLVPYRRGEQWAWWALLISIVLSQVLSLGRALALQTTFGIQAPGLILAFCLLGLLAGAPYLFSKEAHPQAVD
jgi:membrane-associated PAP2 superfamily phosphatase